MRLKNTVAVAGTHGKTTTTSMVAALLDAGGHGSDGHQRRGHQHLRVQCPARRGRVDGGGSRRERRIVPAAAADDRGGHQHRSRASRSLWRFRAREGRVRAVRRACALLRRGADVSGSSRGAGVAAACRGPARGDLWLHRAGGHAGRGRAAGAGRQPLLGRAARAWRGAADRGSDAADAGAAQCAERFGGDRRGGSAADRRRRDPRGVRRVRRGEAALHARGRGRRGDDHRRLRPSSGRDPRGACRRRARGPRAA